MNSAIVYAFGVGMVATFNPCGFAMLPAYLSYFLGLENARDTDSRADATVLRALAVGAAMTAGFVVVFGVLGLVLDPILSSLNDKLPWLTIDLCDRNSELSRQTECCRSDECAKTNRAGFARDCTERDPRIGRAGHRIASAHAQVMIGAEEAVEPELFGKLRNRELFTIRSALLGFNKDAKFHTPRLLVVVPGLTE